MKTDRLTLTLAGAACAAAGFLGHRALATVPTNNALTYTGRLTQNGAPLSGTHTLQVKAYAAQGDTSAACVSPVGPVDVVDGFFRIPVDNCRAKFAELAGLWVEVLRDDVPVAPRTKVGAVPYAVEAERAANVPVITPWAHVDNILLEAESTAGGPVDHQVSTAEWRRVGDSVELVLNTAVVTLAPQATGWMYWHLPADVPDADLTRPGGRNAGPARILHGGDFITCEAYVRGVPARTVSISCSGGASPAGPQSPVPLVPGDYVTMKVTYAAQGWTTTSPRTP
ncbi:MAG: hypothetical protein HY904_12615 [Deltaproteobacteria bacterium]|nr:hypothetical protein [Deltaproteobacteria bacterium]